MKIEALNVFTASNNLSMSSQTILKWPKQIEGPPASLELNGLETLQEPKVGGGGGGGCGLPVFSPYSSQTPWHTGLRGFFSRLFPRYGNYCGPNWSSGRENGSLVWDKAPIDALDYCCYKHDMGYDSMDQADLHRADLVFLSCLKRIPQEGRSAGKSPLSEPFRNIYIFGLSNFLIPYRKLLVEKIRNEQTRKGLTMEEMDIKDRRDSNHMS